MNTTSLRRTASPPPSGMRQVIAVVPVQAEQADAPERVVNISDVASRTFRRKPMD